MIVASALLRESRLYGKLSSGAFGWPMGTSLDHQTLQRGSRRAERDSTRKSRAKAMLKKRVSGDDRHKKKSSQPSFPTPDSGDKKFNSRLIAPI